METINENYLENVYTSNDLQDLYKQISISENSDFDDIKKDDLILEALEKNFDKSFLHMDSKLLINDTNLLNVRFVELIKHVLSKNKYIKICDIFIVYTDYFDLEYNNTFIKLHKKLQDLIIAGYIKLISKKSYDRIEKRLNPDKTKSLLDIYENK